MHWKAAALGTVVFAVLLVASAPPPAIGDVRLPSGVHREDIYLPARQLGQGAVTVTIEGAGPPPPIPSLVGHMPDPGGTILAGRIVARDPGGSYPFTMVHLVLRNLTVRGPLDLSHVASVDLENVAVVAGPWTIAEVAAPSGVGITLPANNNGAFTRLQSVTVIGFETGIVAGEHTNADQVGVWGARTAVEFPFGNHASRFERLLVVWCATALRWTGAHSVTVEQLDIEHYNPEVYGSRWYEPGYDIEDPDSLARGDVRWHVVKGSVGPDDTFLVNGGSGLGVSRL
jgi:hypothetical protein